MAFGVFIHRADSVYDDIPSERYQFPKQYLTRVEECIGDWIIYYEPSKVPVTRGYFAVAKVKTVIPDPKLSSMYVAVIEPGSYIDFGSPVAFRKDNQLVERDLLNERGRISGRAQAAVRMLSLTDFNRIVDRGLLRDDDLLMRQELDNPPGFAGSDVQQPFDLEIERSRVPAIGSRAVRDRNFRRVVLRAYEERCAVTGLKLINGGGRAEVEAAHIKPIEMKGPDIINNGIALSGTVHWMFDRGLITIEDDLRVVISRQVNDPDSVRRMIRSDGYISQPARRSDRPHPLFLRWHRECCFKE